MQTLQVNLGERSYPIFIGQQLLDEPDLFLPHIPGKQVLIVSNTTVAPIYIKRLQKTLSSLTVQSMVLPDGEQYKTLETVNTIFDKLLTERFDRNCTLIALGGGVVGDITGFSAACYQRGVHFLQAPTTLLAQVDSSVGGKTGVNHPLGKNMIGAFYQPRAVIADTDTLNTLDNRQLSAGLAEVIKYGLIRDHEFFKWLKEHIQQLNNRDSNALSYAIEISCRNKAEVVAADERESDQRALLNLGHTYGHAIETGMGYGEWLHGEAVGAGMCMAARQSHELGWINAGDVQDTIDLISGARLPVDKPEAISGERLIELMQVDKKVLDGVLRLVLLKGIGNAIVTSDFTSESLRHTVGLN